MVLILGSDLEVLDFLELLVTLDDRLARLRGVAEPPRGVAEPELRPLTAFRFPPPVERAEEAARELVLLRLGVLVGVGDLDVGL